jgi:toxin CcdB
MESLKGNPCYSIYAGFNPTFKIRGTTVVLHPLEIVSIPVDQLGEAIGSLRDDSQSIVAALDELLHGR